MALDVEFCGKPLLRGGGPLPFWTILIRTSTRGGPHFRGGGKNLVTGNTLLGEHINGLT